MIKRDREINSEKDVRKKGTGLLNTNKKDKENKRKYLHCIRARARVYVIYLNGCAYIAEITYA